MEEECPSPVVGAQVREGVVEEVGLQAGEGHKGQAQMLKTRRRCCLLPHGGNVYLI